MKLIVKDYFISLAITATICLLVFCYNKYLSYQYYNKTGRIYDYIDESENKKQSVTNNRFISDYKLIDSETNENSENISADSIIWVEKNSLHYYTDNAEGKRIHFGDTIQNDFILHSNALSSDKNDAHAKAKFLTWENNQTSDTIGQGTYWYQSQIIKTSPDTLLLTWRGYEFVYKGKLCLLKEN